MIKKADIVLFAIIVILGIVFTVFIYMLGHGGSQVRVEVDGELYGSYGLMEDQIITIERGSHINNITIKDGMVSMESSTCPNQVCVKHRAISKTSETITCLPNKVFVTIEGKGKGGYDVISQ